MIDADWLEQAAQAAAKAAVAVLDKHGIGVEHSQRATALRVAGFVIEVHLLDLCRSAIEAQSAPLH